MRQFAVDDDLVELVWTLAKPRPFENLDFNDALRRVLTGPSRKAPNGSGAAVSGLSAADTTVRIATGKKALSPSAAGWAQQVPELRSRRNLATWQAICESLKIDTAGDSARRKLRNWVRANRPNWPDVPEISSDV